MRIPITYQEQCNKKTMSTVKGKELADLTVKTLQAMKNDRDFNLFYETTKKSTSTIKEISTPGVPRKGKRPNYCSLQYIESNLSTTGEAYYPETTVDHFKPMYMEAIDAIINSIKDSLNNQDSKCLVRLSSSYSIR